MYASIDFRQNSYLFRMFIMVFRNQTIPGHHIEHYFHFALVDLKNLKLSLITFLIEFSSFKILILTNWQLFLLL